MKTRYILGTLLLMAVVVWLAVFYSPDNRLHLIACDVGQGDAILVQKGKTQILIDGGPDNKVLLCLSDHMPFWDRKIELVILTHAQKDHFGGLIEVFQRYKVDYYLASSLDSGTYDYQVLKKVVGGGDTKVITAVQGQVIRLGRIYLDILWPASQLAATNLNDYSVVTILRLGEFEALLTSDISPGGIEKILAAGKIHQVEYIKIPHHGSKNGLTEGLLDAASPQIAVISVGANNSYGHPHEEILQMLKQKKVRILRTDEAGDIEIITDGKAWWLPP
jgi:competence protein ComEC